MAQATALHIKQTEAFVAENPDVITFQRRPRTSTPSGGWKFGAPVALPPQTLRKVASGRVGATTERTTSDGKTVIPTATLVGIPATDVERYDLFTLDGVDHEVVWVNRRPEWRVSAEVVELHG